MARRVNTPNLMPSTQKEILNLRAKNEDMLELFYKSKNKMKTPMYNITKNSGSGPSPLVGPSTRPMRREHVI